jgi:uncharacterized membrane protein
MFARRCPPNPPPKSSTSASPAPLSLPVFSRRLLFSPVFFNFPNHLLLVMIFKKSAKAFFLLVFPLAMFVHAMLFQFLVWDVKLFRSDIGPVKSTAQGFPFPCEGSFWEMGMNNSGDYWLNIPMLIIDNLIYLAAAFLIYLMIRKKINLENKKIFSLLAVLFAFALIYFLVTNLFRIGDYRGWPNHVEITGLHIGFITN